MPALILKKISKPILVVGSIYDNIRALNRILEISGNYQYVIINGNVSKPYDKSMVTERIRMIDQIPNALYNLGDEDYSVMNKYSNEITKWFKTKPNVIIINFANQSNVIVTNGGLISSMTLESLEDNIETSFVSLIDKISWHESYHGVIGYVISNNPKTSNEPHFYSHSLQMGNKYSDNTEVYAQEVTAYGLKRTILL